MQGLVMKIKEIIREDAAHKPNSKGGELRAPGEQVIHSGEMSGHKVLHAHVAPGALAQGDQGQVGVEDGMHYFARANMPGFRAFKNMDQFYELYRFGLAMARYGADKEGTATDAYGSYGGIPSTIAYSAVDDAIIHAALKKVGKEQVELTTPGSSETWDTNVTSPMKPRGPIVRKAK
jgi:hypothetical protein